MIMTSTQIQRRTLESATPQPGKQMHYDKRNGDVAFIEGTHTYFNVKYPNREYISVTTLISKFHEPFDTDFWSSYKAMEALAGMDAFVGSGVKARLLDTKQWSIYDVTRLNINEEDFVIYKKKLQQDYARTNEEACERGSKFHAEQEALLYQGVQTQDTLPFKFPIQAEREYIVVRDDCDFTRERDLKSEFLLYYSDPDHILNLAGMADVVIKDGNDIYIVDYKTNAKGIQLNSYFDRKKKKSQRMYYPLNRLEDCNLIHYTLQLSLYAWMIQKINPAFNIKVLRIQHVSPEGVHTEYDLEYRKEDVELMLKAYKLKLIEMQARGTGKIPETKLRHTI